MKDSQYLKQYVQKHPENKMAWYLLGKEYYKNGQEGKANYCFNEAGEVYEAFEHSKVPGELLREYEEGLLRADRQRDQNRRKIRYVLLGVLMLLLLTMPSAMAPGLIPREEAEEASPEHSTAPTVELEAAEDLPSGEQPLAGSGVLFTARERGGGSSAGNALVNLLQNARTPSVTAVLGLKRSGKWLLWQERLPLEYTLEKTGKGRTVYQSYNPAACDCQPPEPGELLAQAAQWQESQVEQAVLWSAIRAYHNRKGRLPASLKELTAPFPGNWLAGTTPLMKESFAPLKAEAVASRDSGLPSAANNPASGSGAAGEAEAGIESGNAGSEGGIPFLGSPLMIIVDKQKHRLAVISGSVMIRNYEVGLGGDRTPEGSFVISDKVVNPNGRDNGEFGSRGMQLSDSNYAIHGTDEPESIGKDESLGCIRMSRKDVEELFALVPMGTRVEISKGVLPAELLLPKERYTPPTTQNQTNPRKVYHWLN